MSSEKFDLLPWRMQIHPGYEPAVIDLDSIRLNPCLSSGALDLLSLINKGRGYYDINVADFWRFDDKGSPCCDSEKLHEAIGALFELEDFGYVRFIGGRGLLTFFFQFNLETEQ